MSGEPCITGDRLSYIANVSIRELRNEGGDVVDRAARGEQVTITRFGRPVAELRALRPSRAPLSADALLERWRRVPAVDPAALRDDVDERVGGNLDDLLNSFS